MKNQTAILLLSLALLWGGVGCKWNQQDQSSDKGSSSPSETSSNSGVFENDAEQYESADRVIWQKPDIVIEQLGDVAGKVVADLGAGTGYFSRRIAYKGATVIAIDIDPKAIQWMEEQKARFPPELQDRLVIRLAEPNDPKLKPNEVDVVLLVNTYSYIQDRIAYFSRLKETIRPDGQVVIIDFKKKETPFGPDIEERIDVNDVAKELTAAGYKVTAIDESSLDYQYIIKVQSD